MGRPIIHYKGWFFEWSTVVDAPVTTAMRKDTFVDYYTAKYGTDGLRGLEDRLTRAVAKGTSAHVDNSAEDTIAVNRAGIDETDLPFRDVLRSVGIPDAELPPQ